MDLRSLLEKLLALLVVLISSSASAGEWVYGYGSADFQFGYTDHVAGFPSYWLTVWGQRTDGSWGYSNSYDYGETWDYYSGTETLIWIILDGVDLDGDGWDAREEYDFGSDPTNIMSNPWWEPELPAYTNEHCPEVAALFAEIDEPLPGETMAEWAIRASAVLPVLGYNWTGDGPSSLNNRWAGYDPDNRVQVAAAARHVYRQMRDFYNSYIPYSAGAFYISFHLHPVDSDEEPPAVGAGSPHNDAIIAEDAAAILCACGTITAGCEEEEPEWMCEGECFGFADLMATITPYLNLWTPAENGDFSLDFDYEIGGVPYSQTFDFKPQSESALDYVRLVMRGCIQFFFLVIVCSAVVRTFRQW